MAALIGLFLGALLGHLLWQDWGAALGGIAGFFAGVKFSAMRRARAAVGGASGKVDASRVPAPSSIAARQPDINAALTRRVEELERRVAALEHAGDASGATVPTMRPIAEPGTIAIPPRAAPNPS